MKQPNSKQLEFTRDRPWVRHKPCRKHSLFSLLVLLCTNFWWKPCLQKNIEVGTLTESFPQGAVSSSSQKAQLQGTLLPGTFLHYIITRCWNAHSSRVLKPVAAYSVKKTLRISLWQTAVPENVSPFLCSTKPSETRTIWRFEDILEKSFSAIIAVILGSEEVNLS